MTDTPSKPASSRQSERMIRVDQAGEYGAVRIYAGQMAVMGNRAPHAGEVAVRRARVQRVGSDGQRLRHRISGQHDHARQRSLEAGRDAWCEGGGAIAKEREAVCWRGTAAETRLLRKA